MFTGLDNRRDSGTTRQNLLVSLLRECHQAHQPLLNDLLQYFFQTESSNAFLLIKQFNETGKDQSKVSCSKSTNRVDNRFDSFLQILIDHLNNQGLKQSNRHSSASMNNDLNALEEQEKVAHTMKLFRLLSLIIHQQMPGLPVLIKESLLLTNCLQAISRVPTIRSNRLSIERVFVFFLSFFSTVQRWSKYVGSSVLFLCCIDSHLTGWNRSTDRTDPEHLQGDVQIPFQTSHISSATGHSAASSSVIYGSEPMIVLDGISFRFSRERAIMDCQPIGPCTVLHSLHSVSV